MFLIKYRFTASDKPRYGIVYERARALRYAECIAMAGVHDEGKAAVIQIDIDFDPKSKTLIVFTSNQYGAPSQTSIRRAA